MTTSPPEYAVEPIDQRRMVIDGRPEHRAWYENNDAEGHWICDEQGPPGVQIVVTPKGISIHGAPAVMRPSVARWIALRVAEAAGIYESAFGGDGSIARDGLRNRPEPVPPGPQMQTRVEPAPITPPNWWCTCGQSGTSSGGGTIHERNCKLAGTVTKRKEA